MTYTSPSNNTNLVLSLIRTIAYFLIMVLCFGIWYASLVIAKLFTTLHSSHVAV